MSGRRGLGESATASELGEIETRIPHCTTLP